MLNHNFIELKLIGEGSYAKVFKYIDDYYKKKFVLKRANKNLTVKVI
jgi:serine/threonine protein kinase